MNFLDTSIGKWMNQRTTYVTEQDLLVLHQSETIINNTAAIDDLNRKNMPGIKRIYQIKSNTDTEVIDILKDINENYKKKLEHKTINILSHYTNSKNHLSLKTNIGSLTNIEKVWFVNPNLRLGMSFIKKGNKCVAITFSSDIKII